jgi:hypothetical protein
MLSASKYLQPVSAALFSAGLSGLLLLSLPGYGQQPALPGVLPAPELTASGRELTVLSPTLPPEALDRVVLNRLLQEISLKPETVMQRFRINEAALDDMQISIANAGGFINDNEMANVRAMCRAWRESKLVGDARVAAALDAYRERRQITLEFIAMYYEVVIREIESILTEPSLTLFQEYLSDRRRRMAQAGNVIRGAAAENVTSGAEAVDFHCHR